MGPIPTFINLFARHQGYLTPGSRVESKIADENRTKLGELIGTVGASLQHKDDFGDGWQHELLLEEVLLGDETFQQTCVAGVNDVVRPKTVEGRKDSQNFSKYSRTCGAVLAADRACEVNVNFTPTELCKVTGTLDSYG